LRDRVLARLGLRAAPPRDLDGLRALYRAWCYAVPFDNVRKMIALRSGDGCPLPGRFAADFFEAWLAHGAGGTCWPSSNALFALVRACGFEARRVAGSMGDNGTVNHASVKARVEGGDWLVDSSLLTIEPLPLGPRVFVRDDPVVPAEIEPLDGTHVLWSHTPSYESYLPCRLLVDPADHAFYLDGYERSRERSPFNQRLYVRRNRPGELLMLVGRTRLSRTARGLASRDLTRDELVAALRDEIGLGAALLDDWVRHGGLDASLEPPAGPKPEPVTKRPPSRR